MLYTIVPPEQIEGKEKAFAKPEYRYYKGVLLEGTVVPSGFSVLRVISSEPKDFLNKSIYPGMIIKERFLSQIENK